MKRRRLYNVIIPLFLVICVILSYSYYNISANASEYGWKLETFLRGGKRVPTLFLKGRSLIGADILLTIECFPNGEIIEVTCPIRNGIIPDHLAVYVSKDHCILDVGDLPKKCCLTRTPWEAGMYVRKAGNKGYFILIDSKHVGMLLSHLTGAQTLWLVTEWEHFTFRVEGFAEFYDKTYNELYAKP